MRTHTCGELRKPHVGQRAALAGWVHAHRDHGDLIFIDLRDRYGMTQVKFNPATHAGAHRIAEGLRREDVIAVEGNVLARPDDLVNPKLDTGEVELDCDQVRVLNRSQTPPFEIDASEEPSEELRLRHRYLDLRREPMKRAILMRHEICRIIRQFHYERGFVEIETPFLTKSTPEGARDFLVPSRKAQGRFYALPQSPQLFKQLLMVSGFDKYFQLVRCFRDEDTRGDRQPEFTQLDVELSFVEEEDILSVTEQLVLRLFAEVLGKEIPSPIPRMSYDEVINRYGEDAPDVRFGLELFDVCDLAAGTGFRVFTDTLEAGGVVKGIRAPAGAQRFSRKDVETDLLRLVTDNGAKGLAWIKVEADKLVGPQAKYFAGDAEKRLRERTGAAGGDLLFFVADQAAVANKSLAALRDRLGADLGLIKPDEHALLWVVNFPLVEWNDQEHRWDATHHPFTSPRPEDLEKLESDPGAVRARAYDIVLNGTELAGGSIRIHDVPTQQRVFKLLGISDEQARAKFGFLLDGLTYGAPPHGGIAWGIDRLVMLFAGLDTIRDVIPFPKTQSAACPLTGAPADVDPAQLAELGIAVIPSKK
jgi:aspartyl-tRNA synthetase